MLADFLVPRQVKPAPICRLAAVVSNQKGRCIDFGSGSLNLGQRDLMEDVDVVFSQTQPRKSPSRINHSAPSD